ncbi:MAG: hypothetical protein FWE71_15630 [Nocardioidaceae bacterium]|nr:hypothetical protein [Nocardioidaceae bacterium]
MRWRDRILGAVALTPFVIGTVVGASAAGPVDGTEVCAFSDPRIVEASGLVETGGVFVTMNDSGDSARVFAVDPHTCDTVGVTTWDAHAVDQESLAPGGRPGTVWVGDTGDNFRVRKFITVVQVPVGHGDRHVPGQVRRLVYPDGPHDAETLLRDPRTGRLFVVSKEFIGHIYAAPRHLHAGDNRLTKGRSVLGLATDGAFFPDGRHIVLRSYGQAAFYTWPGLTRIATIDLPSQQQGEGIAVTADDRIFLSSEGTDAPVLQVHLSASVRVALAGDSPHAPHPTAAAPPGAGETTSHPAWPWAAGGAVVLVALAGLVVLVARRTRR